MDKFPENTTEKSELNPSAGVFNPQNVYYSPQNQPQSVQETYNHQGQAQRVQDLEQVSFSQSMKFFFCFFFLFKFLIK